VKTAVEGRRVKAASEDRQRRPPGGVYPHHRTELTADFGVLRFVTTPGAEAHTGATSVIEDRVPGVHQTYARPL